MTKPIIIGRMRLRLRGPKTIKMKVSRTFMTFYSSRTPPDFSARRALEDARLVGYDGEEYSFQQLFDHLTDAVFDDDGDHDHPSVALISAMIEIILASPKKSARLAFKKVFKMVESDDYSYTTINNVYQAAKALAILQGKKGPTGDDLLEAQGIEPAIAEDGAKIPESLAYIWDRPAPAPPEPIDDGFDLAAPGDDLEVFSSLGGDMISLRPRRRRVR